MSKNNLKDQKIIEELLGDFRKFLYLIWKHLNLPEPTPIQYDIAYHLQHGSKRDVIEAFRGVGKSWITSAFVCWLILRNPQLKILVVSASKERSDSFATFIKRLIREVPILTHLQALKGQRNSTISFDVAPATPDHSPTVKSVGITGQITGSRADIIIADDVEVLNNSATQTMRDKLSEAVKEFDAILKPLTTSRIIYLGTPQTEMSIYTKLEERGYNIRIWSALYPSIKQIERYGIQRVAPKILKDIRDNQKELKESKGYVEDIIGTPTDAKRFSKEDLQERAISYGKAGFALQFMLDTSLSDADKYPLKLCDLVVMSLNPDVVYPKIVWGNNPEELLEELPTVGLAGDFFYKPTWIDKTIMQEYTGSVLAIDPSGRGADETGYAVIKVLSGYMFLLEIGGIKGGYTEGALLKIANIASKYKVNNVLLESNFGNGMFTELLKPVILNTCKHQCGLEEVTHSKQKERRICDTLEPVLGSHRLIVDRSVVISDYNTTMERAGDLNYSLFYQMTRISRDKGSLIHDDRLDALAIGVNYWTEAMALDSTRELKNHQEALEDKALEDFIDNIWNTGKSPKDNVRSTQVSGTNQGGTWLEAR